MGAKVIIGLALVVGVASLAIASEAQSANYILERSVIGSAGNSSSSTNYKLGSTLGQSSPIGPSNSTNYKLGAGFWYEVIYPTGDVNRDCVVNVLDLILIRNNLNADPGSSTQASRCDLNGDNRINVLDLILARNQLGQRCQ